jgi:hypothetical protein
MTLLMEFLMSVNTLERIAALKQQREFIDGIISKLEEVTVFESRLASLSNGASTTAVFSKSQVLESCNQEDKLPASNPKLHNKAKKEIVTKNDKPMSLGALVCKIIYESKEPISLKEIAGVAQKLGYKSDAKNFANNVYQAVNKLVKAKDLKQKRDNGEILYFAV